MKNFRTQGYTTTLNRGEGYTLLEMLVYGSLLALMIALIANSFAALARIVIDAKADRAVRSSAEAALERVSREVRLAEAINAGASTLDANPGVLVLTTIDPFTGTAQTVTFAVSGGRITVQKDAGLIEHLTSTGVTVTNLVFRHIANGSVSEAIRTELTIGGENFYSTVVLRRSY